MPATTALRAGQTLANAAGTRAARTLVNWRNPSWIADELTSRCGFSPVTLVGPSVRIPMVVGYPPTGPATRHHSRASLMPARNCTTLPITTTVGTASVIQASVP